jgi:Domain of unknown function (DUF1963)
VRRAIAVCILLLALPAAAQARGYAEPEVRAAAGAAGFGQLADRIAASARPTVLVLRRLLQRAPGELGSSRLGGNPDLPVGTPWPHCRGKRMTFLGQLRLSDLPPEAAELGSHDGLLLVFMEVRFQSRSLTGAGLWGGRCTTVIHAPAGTPLARVRPPRHAAVMRLRPAQLRYAVRPDIPDVGMDLQSLAAPLGDVLLIDSEVDRWWDLRDSLHRRRGLLSHRLLGYVDTPNGEGSCWRRTERPVDAWRHLITIGLDFGVGFEVADGGRLQVEISPADLAAGRFDRVCGIFDSA